VRLGAASRDEIRRFTAVAALAIAAAMNDKSPTGQWLVADGGAVDRARAIAMRDEPRGRSQLLELPGAGPHDAWC
jgi:hypothetical protein